MLTMTSHNYYLAVSSVSYPIFSGAVKVCF